jgi:hypothetical protein
MSEAKRDVIPVDEPEANEALQSFFRSALRTITNDGELLVVRRRGRLLLVDANFDEVREFEADRTPES